MVIRELLQKGTTRLRETESTTPQLDAAVLLCHVLQRDRLYLTIHATEQIGPPIEEKYYSLLDKCAAGIPVAYLTGKREFMSLEFEVSPAVLIPRPDTETLCEWVMERCKGKKLCILDVCCGSGCIGLSLAHYLPECRVTMVDISRDVLEVAERNAERLGVLDRIRILCRDMMLERIDGQYDVLVSNPPYIESGRIAGLDKGVREFEPRLALDGGADGLDFYRRLAGLAPGLLKEGGILALEVGEAQAGTVMAYVRKDFVELQTVCDLAGKERVVTAIKK